MLLVTARPNNSFKPTPCRGVSHVLCATLARVRRPATGRLNSGVRPHRMVLVESLKISDLAHAAEASAALASGWVVSLLSRDVTISELDRTYTRRQAHLLSLPGPHAAQLAAAVGELLANIRSNPDITASWYKICGGAEHRFLLLVTDSNLILGCLRTVSKLEVSSERWEEIWQGAA